MNEAAAAADGAAGRRLVLITGVGRSGTSTMSGALHHLGLHVPGPHLGANESNPKGFFESQWAVRFHRRITRAAGINDFDSRPWAIDLAKSVQSADLRAELGAFLAGIGAHHDQVVVKDPRSVWAQALWQGAAADVGFGLRCVLMLRHPAEVVESRTTYYASTEDERARRSYEVCNLARWVNNSLVAERETRGHRRAFVPYLELLEDWRPVLTTVAARLDLRYHVDPTESADHPVDAFIDPGLRRNAVTWADLAAPAELQDIAQTVWEALEVLAGAGQEEPRAVEELDRQSERYSRFFEDAAAVAEDAFATERTDARRRRRGRTAQEQEPSRRWAQRTTGTAPPTRRGRMLLRNLRDSLLSGRGHDAGE